MNYPDYNNSQTEMLDAMLKMIKERRNHKEMNTTKEMYNPADGN